MKRNVLVLLGLAVTLSACSTKMTKEERKAYIKELQSQRKAEALQSQKNQLANLKKYKADAIEKARAFALENAKDLDESKHSYIRFNTPHIYMNQMILGEHHQTDIPFGVEDEEKVINERPGWSQMQTIMVWYPPQEAQPVVIMGTSKKHLKWFEPVKVVRERLYLPLLEKEEAVRKARDFAMQKLLLLQDMPKSQNIVRFQNPTIAKTSYDLDVKETEYYEDLDRKQKYVFDKQVLQQASFIWDTEDSNEKAVVSGLWYTPKQVFGKRKTDKNGKLIKAKPRFLSNWIPVKAELKPTAELTTYLEK